MAQQWGAGQPGYQYPLQTGFPGPGVPQYQPGIGGPGLAPQPTGFPGQRPNFQQPQPTGFPGQQGFQQPQPTGYQLGGGGFQQQPQSSPIPPVPPLPSNLGSNFRQPPPPPSFLNAPPPPPQNRFNTGILPQATGYPGPGGNIGPLAPQVTGYVDPRLSLFSNTFLPANSSAPYAPSGLPQFSNGPPGGVNLQQSIQQYNQEQRGSTTQRMSWALGKAEKKQYDQIFRSWDPQSTGFISGQMALEVFGQSGLPKNDLAKIWSLADTDNRGKLNLAEFHIAMALIYRRLNGTEIPDQLPPELVPPSARDLDTSVTLLKDILRNDTSRSSSGTGSPVSLGKVRSFNDTGPTGGGGRKDATIYKYSDDSESAPYYQSRARHVDRRNVRAGNESPGEDLSSVKRQLEDTAKRLDKAAEDSASRTAEDEALDREMEDLRYRVKRVQEDLEYVSRGPRSVTKDDDRRRLERDLLHLLHERVPEVEKKIEERERRKEREKREWNRDRDRRNERFGRYDDRDYDRDRDRGGGRYDYDRRDREFDRDRDRGPSRGAYDRDDSNRERDRDYDRDRQYDRDRPYSRNRERSLDRERDRDRDYDRHRTPPPAARSPPPRPPSSLPPNNISNPPPPPKATPSPAPQLSSMTPEQRRAYIREQAQQRLQKRKEELGVVVPISPALDTTVEDRLAQEKKEAEEKAKQAEKQAEERERNRRERVENEKAIRQTNTPTPTPPVRPAVSPAPPPPVSAPAPPTPKRAPAPPPPRKPASRTPSATAPPPPSGTAKAPPPAPAPVPVLEEDPEDIRLRQREEEIRKQREARAERLRQLEKEEEESRRAEEEYEKRRKALAENQSTPRATPAPQAAAPSVPFATPPSPPPPPPPPPEVSSSTASTPAAEKSNNPFNRLKSQNSGGPAVPTPPAPTTNGGTNPFFRPTATASPAPPQSKSPAPSAKIVYPVAPGHSEGDDEWDDISEKEDDDTSEDELSASRDTRNKLAQQLFGSILPRPHSAAGSGGSQPSSPAPPAPPPPPAPAAPVAPPPPPAPSAPAAAPVASGDRSALLGAIVGGARLRKTVTNDRSAASVTGQVLGDAAPPPYISDAPSTPSAPLPVSVNGASSVESAPSLPNGNAFTHAHRQSVDWYADLAAEQSPLHVPPTITEQEEETPKTIVPEIQIQPDSAEIVDPLNDVDKSIEYRVRTLYPYEGQRPEDLSFAENLVVTAHPSQSGGDWWYGTLTRDGKSGFFPSTYVQVLDKLQAKAIYSYTGGNEDELPFAEGDILNIVDRSENDWWKTEKDGIIFIVPAAYMELVEESDKGVPETNDDIAPDNSLEDNVDRRPFEIETANGEAAEDESDDDESSEYQSFESDEDEDELRSQEEIQKDREMRARERQRVLEAAGLIVKDEKGSKPPRPARSKSLRGHRPPPGVPNRQSIASTASLDKGLPSRPLSTTDSILRVDDAFERYEAFKQAKERRFSVTSSIDNPPPSPTSTYTSSTLSPSVSKDGDSRFTHSFFHFLSRRTPSVDPDKPRLQISAPIISAPISSSTRGESPNRENGTNSPAFGTSWSSLVDHEVLQEIPQKERRRQEAIFELINTEAAYVRDLQLIVEVFYSNIIPLLDEKERTVIFANIEDLLLTNTTFLSSLEEKQKECRLYIDNIGEIMLANMSNMDVYMEYCVNHGNAIKVLQTLREEKPDLGSKLQQLRDETAARNLDLSSYLLAPMQRITRYPLLIRQILHYTQSEDDRKNIEIALDRVQVILNHINESIREQESRARLKAISKDLWIGQGRLDLTAPTRYMGARKLLKEGPLMKAKSGRKLRAFLCNDILVLTEDVTNTLYRNPIPLSEIDVRDIAGGRDDLAFRLVLSYPRGGDTIALRATSARDCDLWMKAIEEASKRCREAEKRWAHKRRSQI